ncbi:dTMP kinase [Oleispirillum naphthae]|uniref:dTMP kinase n=1 Tax=Oleispirillum naphthae TaxID=2838853 RepID=UPI0030826351
MTVARGGFLTIEGGEGGGKSTQVGLLCAALRRVGKTVLATREPGGSEGAEAIRGLLVRGATGRWDAMSEALLLFAARRDHVNRLIRPALAEGTWVVCDRFGDSTMAYQGYAHGLGREAVETLAQIAIDGFSPDITFILDLPVEQGLARTRSRGANGEDRFERMDVAFHERLRAGFLDIARREPARCRVIDAAAPVEAVHAAILAHLAARWPDLAP